MNITQLHACGVDNVLDALLADRWGPARWHRIDDARKLPWRLKQLAQTLPKGAWRAYADGQSVAFAAGEVTGPEAIAVRFYDASAQQCAAGIWSADQGGSWRLQEVID